MMEVTTVDLDDDERGSMADYPWLAAAHVITGWLLTMVLVAALIGLICYAIDPTLPDPVVAFFLGLAALRLGWISWNLWCFLVRGTPMPRGLRGWLFGRDTDRQR